MILNAHVLLQANDHLRYAVRTHINYKICQTQCPVAALEINIDPQQLMHGANTLLVM